MAMCI